MQRTPPKLGPPQHYIHVVWLDAPEGEPSEYFDELDGQRWTIRCVRKFADGSLAAFSYDTPNWADVMPAADVPPSEIIDQDPQFSARDISAEDFATIWKTASGEPT
jgi:hypothetical protein